MVSVWLTSGYCCPSCSVAVMSSFWGTDGLKPLPMGFPRQVYWSGLPFPFPGDLPDPGIESGSPALQADALPSEPPGMPQTRNQTCPWRCRADS